MPDSPTKDALQAALLGQGVTILLSIRKSFGTLIAACVVSALAMTVPVSAQNATPADAYVQPTAQQMYDPEPMPFGVTDIRIGILAHRAHPEWIPLDVTRFDFSRIEDVSFEVLFASPQMDVFTWIGSPKFNLGGTLNLNNRVSFVRGALTWQAPVFDSPVFVEGSLGLGIHNGPLTRWGNGWTMPQGCRWTIYSSAGVGVNMTDNVYAMLSYEHISNANLCAPNPGISNVGVKMGMRF